MPMGCTNSKTNHWNAQFVWIKKLQIWENVAANLYATPAIFLQSVRFAAEKNYSADV
jgi:hypothetical protein